MPAWQRPVTLWPGTHAFTCEDSPGRERSARLQKVIAVADYSPGPKSIIQCVEGHQDNKDFGLKPGCALLVRLGCRMILSWSDVPDSLDSSDDISIGCSILTASSPCTTPPCETSFRVKTVCRADVGCILPVLLR